MRIIKLFEEFDSDGYIKFVCDKYGISNYTINSDRTIDVDGPVYICETLLEELPLKFNKVSGSFTCSKNKLTSLEGSPKEVGGHFYCDKNLLTTLKGGPEIVGDEFACNNNKLTSLIGGPKITDSYFCYNNNLTSLEGSPKRINGMFSCFSNKLMTLKGCSENISGEVFFDRNPVYEVWKLINDKEYLEIFLDYDMIDGDELNLVKLNDILSMIGNPRVSSVKGYKCI